MVPSDHVVSDPISLLGQLEEAERQVHRFRSLSEETTGTAQSPDGLIEATVGMYGEVREFVLDPRVFRTPDAGALAEQIRAVINAAIEDAQRSAARQLSSLLPRELDASAGLAFEPLLAQLDKTRRTARP